MINKLKKILGQFACLISIHSIFMKVAAQYPAVSISEAGKVVVSSDRVYPVQLEYSNNLRDTGAWSSWTNLAAGSGEVGLPLQPDSAPLFIRAGMRPTLLNPDGWRFTAPALFKVRFLTTRGNFVVEVKRGLSPLGVDRFYNLLRSGFFNDLAVFRVTEHIAQFGFSGNPDVNAAWHYSSLENEISSANNLRGTISFAQSVQRTTQFLLNIRDNPALDQMGYISFGKVVSGLEVVDGLYSGYGDRVAQSNFSEVGNGFLRARFPNLDYIIAADLLDSNGIVDSSPLRFTYLPNPPLKVLRGTEFVIRGLTNSRVALQWRAHGAPDSSWLTSTNVVVRQDPFRHFSEERFVQQREYRVITTTQWVTQSGLQITESRLGTGMSVTSLNQYATVHYSARLSNQTNTFDNSRSTSASGIEFPISMTIPGFAEGLLGMQIGGLRRLTVPPDLAYGQDGVGIIPPNATIVFEVELLGIRNPP